MQKQFILTEEGLKKLEEELEECKTVKRKEMAEKIKLARSYGDLSENSEYDDAKNEQAILEARIAEIEQTLKNAKVVDSSTLSSEHVHIGSTVKVLKMDGKIECIYSIVGSNEANPIEGKISDESPIGRALLGAKIGDTVEAEIPVGLVKFKILELL